ncbi:hypothetical protein OCK74_21905 [Chitinophagaceae bacterium LB-8]|uniref:Uncharacterized protein n=1 Tax=Paraflavisolibacter caeni TaxID=2982496 RepID=A0A9X2XZH7_9BACT|nr:hypothetical protein [Paraflavisolibacter caeni]MCU7551791.1 hypothetical protein [Paraflavisolibacter caeni]
MNIEQEFEDLKNWAEKNSILLAEGDFTQGKWSSIVELPYKGKDSIELFKQIVKRLNVKLIVYELVSLDAKNYEILEETIEYLNDEEIKEKFERIHNYQNKFFGYTLHFFENGMTFKIENYVKETDDYLDVKDSVYEFIEENGTRYKILPQERVIELGKQLALHENYPKLKNRTQRVNLAEQLFNKQFDEISVQHSYGARLVVAQAETYYETVIKPRKDKELKKKIKELLDEGWTKVKIAAELGISKDIVNKYI